MSDKIQLIKQYMDEQTALGHPVGLAEAKRVVEERLGERAPLQTDEQGRIPCPHCAEPVMPAATICPHCRGAILSHDKQKNAWAVLVTGAIAFILIYYAISTFLNFEARRQTDQLMQDTKTQTEQMLKDLGQ